jgi:hypothetical protein
MKITKSKLREIINEELDAILDEAKKGDWPKKLKKGRFTKYCKRQGFDRGPGIGCAEKAMDSDSASVRGMASFYTNTVKKEGCPDPDNPDKEVIEHVGTVSEPPPHARRVATPMKADPVGVQGDLFLDNLLGALAAKLGYKISEKEFKDAFEQAAYRQAERTQQELEEVTGAQEFVAAEVENKMYTEGTLDETGMSGYEGPGLPPEAMEELVTAVLHVLRRMGFMKKEVPPEEKDA